jgi:TonB family protein
MRLSRILLPLFLVTLPACAANAGVAAESSPPAEAAAGVRLLNRAEGLRLMQSNDPLLLQDARVTGEVRVRVTLDAAGAVTASTVTSTTQEWFSAAALEVAPRLRFSAPAAAGAQATVRMLFAPVGTAQLGVVER